MFCENCGKQMSETAKFCSYCGKPVRAAEKAVGKMCPSCGWKGEADRVYCEECGTLLVETESPAGKKSDNVKVVLKENIKSSGFHNSAGQLLKTVNLMSYYEGEPTLGMAKATGTLHVYDDHVEFIKKLGNAAGAVFGAVGMALASKKVKSDPVDRYDYKDIFEVRIGKYAGVYNTLVLVMNSGTVSSFVPAAPGSSLPDEIRSLIYMNM